MRRMHSRPHRAPAEPASTDSLTPRPAPAGQGRGLPARPVYIHGSQATPPTRQLVQLDPRWHVHARAPALAPVPALAPGPSPVAALRFPHLVSPGAGTQVLWPTVPGRLLAPRLSPTPVAATTDTQGTVTHSPTPVAGI